MDILCKTCHGLFRQYCGQNMKDDMFVYGMRAAVCGLNLIPFYVMNYELLGYMSEIDAYLYKVLFNGLMFLTLVSYWMASLIKPIKIEPVSDLSGDLKVCQWCSSWKPERTHHCKICGTCVPKMDHHCPWIGNCVGFHNYKPFFLFCFFQMLEGAVYFSATINRVFHGKKAEPLSIGGLAGYWFTNLIDMPICFALIGLSGSILCDIFSNMTTLENMGDQLKRYPCYGLYSDPYL